MRSSSLQRKLDRALGGLLITAGAAVRRPRRIPDTASRIAVLQPTAIGDTLIASGVLAAVEHRFPEAEITVFHGPSNAAVLPLIDARFESRMLSFTKPWQALAALRAIQPDLVIDLTPWPRTTALCAMGSGAACVGYDSEGQGRAAAFDVAMPHLSSRHELENARELASAVAHGLPYRPAIKTALPRPAMVLPYDRLILLHTSAGGSRRAEKAWPLERWAALARRLHDDGFAVALSGTAVDIGDIDQIRTMAGLSETQAVSLVGRLSLSEMAYVLKWSRCLVSVDTGVVHLASAVDGPVVGIYGPTRSHRWGPWSARGLAVDSPHPDAGYCSLGFESRPNSRDIMNAISVETVHEAVHAIAAESWVRTFERSVLPAGGARERAETVEDGPTREAPGGDRPAATSNRS